MGDSWDSWLLGALAVACAAAAGFAVAWWRARRRHLAALEERGWLLEREREAGAEAAVSAERTRIAAELHDIVSHNVSLMVVQAGAAREVLTAMPQEAASAISAVESAGRDAMTELRQLLGLLTPAADGNDEPYDGVRLAPQPSLSGLSRLVDRFAFAGLPVEVRISGEPRSLAPAIDVTAYRIIQEALTNVLKHAEGATATVTVSYGHRNLRVEVLNAGPTVLREPAADVSNPAAPRTTDGGRSDGAGRGLIGLRERVAVYGGDLDARRRLGGGYRVRARLPLDGK
ncbi:histidine kinase [Kitasatospora sp. RB6PN24]|uniref:sensor histidine kinase n=1 Tax=Kitasatospora humi TaxID=2893891 RepID=UPI001E3EC732|nr:histidine kinase [Kitasatospora humi]MCC9310857.1 histidine kinase [Kitasatospora humi]